MASVQEGPCKKIVHRVEERETPQKKCFQGQVRTGVGLSTVTVIRGARDQKRIENMGTYSYKLRSSNRRVTVDPSSAFKVSLRGTD